MSRLYDLACQPLSADVRHAFHHEAREALLKLSRELPALKDDRVTVASHLGRSEFAGLSHLRGTQISILVILVQPRINDRPVSVCLRRPNGTSGVTDVGLEALQDQEKLLVEIDHLAHRLDRLPAPDLGNQR